MKRSAFLLGLLLLVAGSTAALAQSGGGFELQWSSINATGTSRGGDYTLSATAGQPDSGHMAGGDFGMTGGFWQCSPPGDFNANSQIDVQDVFLVAAHWGEGVSPYDLDHSGQVTVRDIMLVAGTFGATC